MPWVEDEPKATIRSGDWCSRRCATRGSTIPGVPVPLRRVPKGPGSWVLAVVAARAGPSATGDRASNGNGNASRVCRSAVRRRPKVSTFQSLPIARAS